MPKFDILWKETKGVFGVEFESEKEAYEFALLRPAETQTLNQLEIQIIENGDEEEED